MVLMRFSVAPCALPQPKTRPCALAARPRSLPQHGRSTPQARRRTTGAERRSALPPVLNEQDGELLVSNERVALARFNLGDGAGDGVDDDVADLDAPLAGEHRDGEPALR